MMRQRSEPVSPGMEAAGMVRFEVGGQTIEIPVDSEGKVPTWALAMRFQEVGNVEDLDDRQEVVLPARCTPEEVIRWWMDPSSCDIEGIDTKDSKIYDVSSVKDPEKRKVQRRIAVVDADHDEQIRIRKVLSDSFTAQELREMASNGSFVIRSVPYMGGATGCYYRRQDGVEVPLIVLEKGNSPDNMAHEVVHHLRATGKGRDGSLSSDLDEGGRFSAIKRRLPSGRRKVEDEERMTVAETMVRTGLDPVQSGYYDGVEGKDSRQAYIEDLYTLTGTPPTVPPEEIPRLTGKAARNAVLHGYAYTNISRAQILSKDVRKRA